MLLENLIKIISSRKVDGKFVIKDDDEEMSPLRNGINPMKQIGYFLVSHIP